MDDVYDLLLRNKLEDESFSEEIRRILSKKKSKKLIDYYGIISHKDGDEIKLVLEKKREENIKLKKTRYL